MRQMKDEAMAMVDHFENAAAAFRAADEQEGLLAWSENIRPLVRDMVRTVDGMLCDVKKGARFSSSFASELARASVLAAFFRIHAAEIPSQQRFDELRSTLLCMETWASD